MLVVALLLTGGLTLLAAAYAKDQAEARFERDADVLELRTRNRMNAYEEVLLGAKGLFLVKPNVDRREWRAYYETLQTETHLPGLQGLGWAELIPPEALAEHEERVRAEGFPTYAVYPGGSREVYTAIVFLEPFSDRNLRAFGFDMFSEPVRREAMERSRDSALPALSGKVTLVQENGTDPQSGFLMYVPVYRPGALVETVAQRRDALVGWVYAPFRAKDLVSGILPDGQSDLGFRIYDGPSQDPLMLLYDSHETAGPGATEGGGPTRVRQLVIAGRTWTLHEEGALDAVPTSVRYLPVFALAVGLVTSGLLFGIAWVMGRTQERAQALAEAMTRELRSSNEALQAFTYVVSHDLKEPVRGIDAYLRVLREDHAQELSPDAQRLVVGAHEANARLAALLKSLLDLSRVGHARLQLVDVRVDDVLGSSECRLAYQRLAEASGSTVDADASVAVRAAVPILAQALGNLVANAIAHGGEGPRVVRVVARREGDVVEVSVEDDGRGYPPEVLAAFNAGHPAPRGFGLVIAQRAVERLGGRFWLARSDALGGAAARFSLPAAQPRDT